jgi:hypothetical protein
MADETITKAPITDPPEEEKEGPVSPQDYIGTGSVPTTEPVDPTPN